MSPRLALMAIGYRRAKAEVLLGRYGKIDADEEQVGWRRLLNTEELDLLVPVSCQKRE